MRTMFIRFFTASALSALVTGCVLPPESHHDAPGRIVYEQPTIIYRSAPVYSVPDRRDERAWHERERLEYERERARIAYERERRRAEIELINERERERLQRERNWENRQREREQRERDQAQRQQRPHGRDDGHDERRGRHAGERRDER